MDIVQWKYASKCTSAEYARGWNDAMAVVQGYTSSWFHDSCGNTYCVKCGEKIPTIYFDDAEDMEIEPTNYCPSCGRMMVNADESD